MPIAKVEPLLTTRNVSGPFDYRLPEAMGDAARLRLDWRVLVFSTAVAGLAAIAFGLVPALRGSQFTPQDAKRIIAEHSGVEVDYAINLWSRTF